ncbi:N-acetylglucosaminyl-phosphatidylinositol de-N-acetylase [Conoideocrella luteorostrata]|uniref:N-acetylglucosaminylphosphatidylinositol deacetylase n=1 Tax=Conoideocrella luteorostrata TaxID=1105319 RepID=A0AAJ0CB04_9HYPO|nr:N-acetylglucosaminyl-phosphatidylinositol de-N-acetylase [Conoideocrella luteorostrata]
MDFIFGLLATLAVVIPALYMYTASVVQTRFPALQNKRICLLIAHPDDEAMFFAPTVLALTRPETGNHVKILCLSTGNADGLGETRKKELVKSGMHLGLRDEDDVFVVDNPSDFPDSMTATWDENTIANLLCSAFAPQLGRQRADDSAKPTANIDILITFDHGGVSSHPNHISLYHGARAFVAALMRGKAGWACPVDLYSLTSVNMLRKYSGLLDVFATMAAWAIGTGSQLQDKAHPGGLVLMNQLVGEGAALPTAWGAMTQAHKSQMRWFRYFWIVFSRYMVINDLKLEKVKSK